MTDLETVKTVVKALDSKKAGNIRVLKIGDLTILANYFVIAEGGSNTQVKALADEVDYQMGLLGVEPKSMSGIQGATWITIDYIDVVVHIFQSELRDYYRLEDLWADAPMVEYEDVE
jgi:ribosome-associated protein